MMVFKKIAFVWLVLSLLVSCQKNELPEDEVSSPLFYLEGQIMDEEVLFTAGPNNVVLETHFDLTEDDFPQFVTEFYCSECPNDEESLFIEFIGEDNYFEGVEFLDLISEGAYPVDDYTPGLIEGSFFFGFNGFDFENVELTDQIGTPLFSGTEDFDVFLEDGQFQMSSFFFDNEEFLVNFSYGFTIENGLNCAAQPSLVIEDGFIAYYDTNEIAGNYIIQINGATVFMEEGVPVPIEDILVDGQEFIQTVEMIDVFGGNCESFSSWVFLTEFLDDFEIDFEMHNHFGIEDYEPSTVLLEYTNEDNITYGSEEDSFSQIVIESIVPYYDDPFGREAYRIEMSGQVNLYNMDDPSDVVILNIDKAFLPFVME